MYNFKGMYWHLFSWIKSLTLVKSHFPPLIICCYIYTESRSTCKEAVTLRNQISSVVMNINTAVHFLTIRWQYIFQLWPLIRAIFCLHLQLLNTPSIILKLGRPQSASLFKYHIWKNEFMHVDIVLFCFFLYIFIFLQPCSSLIDFP